MREDEADKPAWYTFKRDDTCPVCNKRGCEHGWREVDALYSFVERITARASAMGTTPGRLLADEWINGTKPEGGA